MRKWNVLALIPVPVFILWFCILTGMRCGPASREYTCRLELKAIADAIAEYLKDHNGGFPQIHNDDQALAAAAIWSQLPTKDQRNGYLRRLGNRMRNELGAETLLDPWRRPYRAMFNEKLRVLRIWSGGPSGELSESDNISVIILPNGTFDLEP